MEWWVEEVAAVVGPIASVARVSGGSISDAYAVTLDGGGRVFVKAAAHLESLLREEVASLEALRATGTVRVPAVVGTGEGWLALEWLQRVGAQASADDANRAWAALGRALADLHRHVSSSYGWRADNPIGTVPQSNRMHSTWPTFWASERLLPSVRAVRDAGMLDARACARIDKLIASIDVVLAGVEADGASLLHGDLWGGNAMLLADGNGAVFDPSCYNGHREVDLAMADLFGGFSPSFFGAYRESAPLLPGHDARRRVYQLYYLLVHVIMFGGAYAGRTMDAVDALGF